MVGFGVMRVRGTCHALFAFDLGLAVDLDRAETLISEAPARQAFRNSRRAPRGDITRPRPLRVVRTVGPVDLGGHSTDGTVDTVLHDFGGATTIYSIPFEGDLGDLLLLADLLYENDRLLADGRLRIEELLALVAPAVREPRLSEIEEDYVVYQLEPQPDLPALWTREAGAVARVLRTERGDLSESEVEDALALRMSYSGADAAIVDWNAALLVGEGMEDERAVLEFANVQLLEWRLLDLLLDRAIDTAWETLNRPSGLLASIASRSVPMRRIARMQADYAFLFEGVSNAMKLVGDQYLARLYRVASDRFHLGEWEQAIGRKLGVLDGIHEKLVSFATTTRMEILEWIIIVLIVISIAVYFVPQ